MPSVARLPNQRYVPLSAGATYLTCTERFLRDQIAAGKITGYRMGTRSIRVDLDELDALLTPIPTTGGGRVA